MTSAALEQELKQALQDAMHASGQEKVRSKAGQAS